jgi:hypothetical protein
VKRWLAVPMLALSVIPAMAFDDAAFCQRLTDFAAKANEDKGSAIDGLSSNEGVSVSCDTKTLIFHKALALSMSELGTTWHASKQQEWNAIYCANPDWSPILANGWKVAASLTTFDGKRMTIFAQCW